MGRFATTSFIFLACTTMLYGQSLKLNSPVEELPPLSAETAPPSVDLDGLLDLAEPNPQDAKADPGDVAEEMPAPPVNVKPVELVEFQNSDVPAEDEPPALPVNNNTKTKPVRELAGKPVLRGPVHEAFAEPIQNTPSASQLIRKAPPAAVDEVPPEMPPETRNMEWISGYWAWDMQLKEHIWVSGVWRKKLKNRIWVPGRWETVERGYQWVPGVWMPTDPEGQIVKKEVLPLPPKSLEKGPNSPAPTEEHFWIPGIWQQNEADEYAWRAGYWSRSQKNWVWVPDHYAWAPGGCVFVPGYWDYTWERRGTLFAPCTFENVNRDEQISYRPTNVIDTNQWLLNLWVGPRSGNYFYGDYYDCADRGYTPWYQYYGSNRGVYDPFYSYYRWQFPTTYGIGLYGYLNGLHTHYGPRTSLRPNVRISPYGQYGRPNYGVASLFGDVRGLSALVNIDPLGYSNRGRYGRDYFDDYYDLRRGYGRDPYGIYRSRTRVQQPQVPQRRILGYANGAPIWSDQRSGGTKRGEIGVSRSRDLDSQSRNRTTSTPRATANRNSSSVENFGAARRSVQGNNGGTRRTTPPTIRPNTSIRANPPLRANSAVRANPSVRSTDSVRSNSITRQRTRTPSVQRPQQTVRPTSRPTVRSNPSVSTPRSRPAVRSTTRQNPSVSSPRPVVRAKPAVQPRSTPAVQSRPSPGFSISGMKNSRNRADVQKQRAAMQKLIQDRKGGSEIPGALFTR